MITPIGARSRIHKPENIPHTRLVTISKLARNYNRNQKIIKVLNSNSWLNQPAFLIGGGESIKGFDFSLLDNFNTIGVNKTFQYYQKAKINYSMDHDLYSKIYDGKLSNHSGVDVKNLWESFQGYKIFITPTISKDFSSDVYLVQRLSDKELNRDLSRGIYPGRNSALGALMLAVALGANPIYLLGYDMIAKTQTHWHDGYPDNRDIVTFNAKLEQYRLEFDAMSTKLVNAGIRVVNLNPKSNLRCFLFSTLEVVLKGLNANIPEHILA